MARRQPTHVPGLLTRPFERFRSGVQVSSLVGAMYTLNFTFVWANSQLLRDGLLVTLELSSVALFFSVIVGLIGAYARTSPFRPISSTAGAYVEFVRNVPLLLLLYFVYFALPSFHLTLSERISAISALSLYSGAYMIEIFRAGILAVGRGQVEAGKALGLTGFQIARAVVVPQALRIVLPSMGNQFISLIKDSSLAEAIGVRELTFAAVRINDISWRIFEVYAVIASIYLAVTYLAAFGLRMLERRLRFRS